MQNEYQKGFALREEVVSVMNTSFDSTVSGPEFYIEEEVLQGNGHQKCMKNIEKRNKVKQKLIKYFTSKLL